MRCYLSVIICLLLSRMVLAQDDSSPYQIALQRIQEAKVGGATSLDLSRLGLMELPPEIGELTSLETLQLNNNQLSSLPPEIGNLSHLHMLYLVNNNLSGLPPEIAGLTGLQRIQLENNELGSLPPEIGLLSILQILRLDNNNLSSLPPEIGNLSKLEVLHLSGNLLSSLPIELSQLPRLCYLDISNNQFQQLPSELGNAQHLAESCPNESYSGLVVDGNPLISPPPEVVNQGTAAILAYLRNQAWWHLQRLTTGAAGSIGLLAAIVLGLRWRNRRGRKEK